MFLLERAEVEGRGSTLMAHYYNSSCSHSPGRFCCFVFFLLPINAGFLLCIKHPFVVKQNAPKKTPDKRLLEGGRDDL